MSAATTIPAVLAALVARFEGVVSDDVQVIYGSRAGVTLTRKHVVTVGTAVDFEQTPSTFGDVYGSSHDDETYDVACSVECTLQGQTDQTAATVRALGEYEAIRQAMGVPDETLGVTGVLWARVAGRARVLPATAADTLKQGRSCAVAFTIRVTGVL